MHGSRGTVGQVVQEISSTFLLGCSIRRVVILSQATDPRTKKQHSSVTSTLCAMSVKVLSHPGRASVEGLKVRQLDLLLPS